MGGTIIYNFNLSTLLIMEIGHHREFLKLMF